MVRRRTEIGQVLLGPVWLSPNTLTREKATALARSEMDKLG